MPKALIRGLALQWKQNIFFEVLKGKSLTALPVRLGDVD